MNPASSPGPCRHPRRQVRAGSGIVFEQASTACMPAVIRLEQAVFASEQAIPDELIPIPESLRPIWWCIRTGGAVIGAVAAWIENGQWHWGRFAIEPGWRGQGIGRWLAACSLEALFRTAAATPDADPDSVHIEAREAARRLLLPLGGEVTGPSRDFYGQPVTPMILRRSAFRPCSQGDPARAEPRPVDAVQTGTGQADVGMTDAVQTGAGRAEHESRGQPDDDI